VMIRSGSGRRRSSRSLSNLSSGAWRPVLLLILHQRRDHQLTSSRAILEKGWLQFKRSRSISSSPNPQRPGHRIRIRKHQRLELACSGWIIRRIKKSDFTHRRICIHACLIYYNNMFQVLADVCSLRDLILRFKKSLWNLGESSAGTATASCSN
jgi:hypothetical protein